MVYIKGEKNGADLLSRPNNCIAEIQSFELARKERLKILGEYRMVSGHGSGNSMLFLLEGKYYWNGIKQDVKYFARSCSICQKEEKRNAKTKNRVIKTCRRNEL